MKVPVKVRFTITPSFVSVGFTSYLPLKDHYRDRMSEKECSPEITEVHPVKESEFKSPTLPITAPAWVGFPDIFTKWPLSCLFSKSEEC